jgi:hypothetical protein
MVSGFTVAAAALVALPPQAADKKTKRAAPLPKEMRSASRARDFTEVPFKEGGIVAPSCAVLRIAGRGG